MIEAKSTPKANEGFWLWMIKMVSGLLIILLLLIHFVINHLTGTAGGGLLSFEEVVQMYTSPGYILLEVVFLVTVVSHGLIGLRAIVLDLNLARNTMRVIDPLLIILGVGSVVYGIWLLFAVASQMG
jgi:succinate dehydrogenase / fumarate reductase membrane anchor subunit